MTAGSQKPVEGLEGRKTSSMGLRLWHRFVRWDLAGFTIAVTGVVALAQVCVLSVGQFNLALTAIGAMVGLFSGWLMQVIGLPFGVAMLVRIVAGGLAGALQGTIIVRIGINPFIVSL